MGIMCVNAKCTTFRQLYLFLCKIMFEIKYCHPHDLYRSLIPPMEESKSNSNAKPDGSPGSGGPALGPGTRVGSPVAHMPGLRGGTPGKRQLVTHGVGPVGHDLKQFSRQKGPHPRWRWRASPRRESMALPQAPLRQPYPWRQDPHCLWGLWASNHGLTE